MRIWTKLLVFSLFLFAFFPKVAVNAHAAEHRNNIVYSTILGPNQSITGVRGYDAAQVLCTGSTQSNGVTVGMWWLGSLETGVGTLFTPTPNIPGQTVTSSLFYGPNTALFDPSLGSNIRITGSYQYAESTTLNNGFLYEGPLDGSGTWLQINVPSDAVGGAAVESTVPHSVMGDFVVGNYNLQNEPMSGNAFLYQISTGEWTVFTIDGSTSNLTSAYGIWQNGNDSYTIVGGSKHKGINKAYLIDYQPSTKNFSRLKFYKNPHGFGLTHFEGITGTRDGYHVAGSDSDGAAFVSIERKKHGSFSKARWTPVQYPGSSTTTSNTVYERTLIGVYTLPNESGVNCYTAKVLSHKR